MMKYILISGGGTGIGLEIAKLCVEEGITPIVLGRREEVLEKASKELNNCPYISVDLSSNASKKEVRNKFSTLPEGKVIGLINNAGVYKPSSFLNSKPEDWQDQFNINVLSAVYLSQEFFSDLKDSGGAILNISSTLGVRPITDASAYSASKAAMNNITQSMAIEFAPHGIRVNAICPGIVNTPIHKKTPEEVSHWKENLKGVQPLNRIGETTDIAKTALHLIIDSPWTTGTLINIDGGILLNS